MSNDDIYTRIRSGEFKPTLPYPDRVREPAILRRAVKDLTDAEIATIPAVRAKFTEDRAIYDRAVRGYQEQAGERENAFVEALAEYHGVTGHPKAGMVYSKAYEHGHSAGQEEVATYYSDFVDLIK